MIMFECGFWGGGGGGQLIMDRMLLEDNPPRIDV
jgi:hypothetical protein